MYLILKGELCLQKNPIFFSHRSVYDFKFVLLGGGNEEASDRGFYLGLGRSKVFK